MTKTLHLVMPGLLGPWPDRRTSGFPIPRVPALERLLAKASVTATGVYGLESTLFRLFGLTQDTDGDLPIAPITRLADSGKQDKGWWFRADPVHLHADLHRVVLSDARALQIQSHETQTLITLVNNKLPANDWTLEAPHTDRWYLGLDQDPELRTYPLYEAIGQDINSLLPYGPRHRPWHTLLTEIQMLFHETTVNTERENRGLPSINSVWLWGGGVLPGTTRSPVTRIFADDPLTRGLALLTGTAFDFAPANAQTWDNKTGNNENALIVLETARFDPLDKDPWRWNEHLAMLEANWFDPCLARLKERTLQRLCLYPCNSRLYTITPANLRRFWRPARSLTGYL